MNSSKNYFTYFRTFTSLMTIAVLVGIVFFATNNLDFLIACISFNKFSISNIAYFLSKIFGTIIIPLVFIVPSMNSSGRIKTAKMTFILFGICQLLSLSWIVEYIVANGFNNIFSNDAITSFQTSESWPSVASYAFWDTYSWAGSIFTVIFSALCIYAGLCIDDTKKKVCTVITSLAVLRPLLPIISNVIMGKEFLSGFWLTNNYVDVVCWICIAIAMFTAARYDETWISLIWDQPIPQNEDENEYEE